MPKHPFANFIFLLVLITFLAIRHSVGVFGPTAHIGALTGEEPAYKPPTDSEFFPRGLARIHPSRAAAFFDDAWQRAIVLEEWRTDYTASEWDLFRASSRVESDLIEARSHVANAEVFTGVMHQNERAIKELARADTWLQDAQGAVRTGLIARLSTVRGEIEAAEAKERGHGASSAVPFESIKADLDRLLGVVRSSKT